MSLSYDDEIRSLYQSNGIGVFFDKIVDKV